MMPVPALPKEHTKASEKQVVWLILMVACQQPARSMMGLLAGDAASDKEDAVEVVWTNDVRNLSHQKEGHWGHMRTMLCGMHGIFTPT